MNSGKVEGNNARDAFSQVVRQLDECLTQLENLQQVLRRIGHDKDQSEVPEEAHIHPLSFENPETYKQWYEK